MPVETREFALRGHVLLTPVRIAWRSEDAWKSEVEAFLVATKADTYAPSALPAVHNLVEVRTDDGRPLPSALYWIGWTADRDATIAWLSPPGVWRVEDPLGAPEQVRGGSWTLLVDLRDARDASTITIDGRALTLHWLDASPNTARQTSARTATPNERTAITLLRALIEPATRDPARRWRARLLLERLGERDDAAPLDHPVLEVFATQIEGRWRAGLDRMASIDASLAARLRYAITPVVRFRGGELVPVWSAEGAALSRLLGDLLDPAMRDPERRSRIGAWLSALPEGVAWVEDDAVASRHIAIGVASLLPEPTTASASLGGADLQSLPSGETATLIVSTDGAPEGVTVDVRIGETRIDLPVMSAPAPGAPPGVRMGPFAREHTLATWLADAPIATDEAWLTAAMLHRRPGEQRWEVYIECRAAAAPDDADAQEQALDPATPEYLDIEAEYLAPPYPSVPLVYAPGKEPPEFAAAVSQMELPSTRIAPPTSPEVGALPGAVPGALPGAGAGGTDAVRLWIGPTGAPLAALRVDRRGFVVNELVAGADPRPIEIREEHDRWIAVVEIPERFTRDRDVLLLGLERIDARGVRTTWPRAAFPWQTAPSRAAINLRAWRGLERVSPASAP
ncbi:MAG: hypothetical protein EA379_11570 [Phycisphaerales bacterium]|nr:MAG: hypothetical protein EA379_11570 [Phycisphaerales bacterium]